MIIGTAGHIDHGKTTLVRALTGVDTDRLPEERRRGITIELGFAPLDLPGIGRVGMVDVPGHEGFIRTMVAGATGVDVGLLVIAADEGVMPQTREHLGILSLLGVHAVVVALTKCELADAEWLELVRDDVRGLLADTPYGAAALVAVSARSGEGLDELRQALAAALGSTTERSRVDLFRLPIDRVFTIKGTGTVVTGTSWSGRLTADSDVRLYPGDRHVRIRGIQAHGEATAEAGPGARLAVALGGVDLDDVHRGMTLATHAAWSAVMIFHAQVTLTEGAAAFRPREWLRLHVATMEVSARVVLAEGTGLARVVTEEPVVLRAGDRFVLRRSQPLATIGGGIVVDPAPVRPRSRPLREWHPDPGVRLARLLEELDEQGVPIASLPVRLGCEPEAVAPLLEHSDGVPFRGVLYRESSVRQCSEVVVEEVFAYHTSHSTEAGLPMSQCRGGTANGALADLAIDRVIRAGTLQIQGGMLQRPSWFPRLSGDQEAAANWISKRLREAGREPPSVAELEQEWIGTALLPVLRFMERRGAIVAVEADRYYERTVLGTLLGGVVSVLQGRDEPCSPAVLREELGTSRKFLMPFLEFCDRERISERRGDGRVISQGAPERLAAFLDTLSAAS